ncbi:ABC transporter ATP-binding protein [Chelatococcus sp. GCM10030263]|uniref:ABC transporter ATP-binding protein n=1 Tax=Chelatococcus sp. GCM10030263 TaxID=3273387 RepID=UPI003605AEEF
MIDHILSVRGLTKAYNDLRALDDVSIDVAAGEFIALLGPSGCGKTTLLRCIGGFADASSGDILIEGKSVIDAPAYRRPVNTVFQSYALFPHMTLAENVAFGPRRSGVASTEIAARVAEALEMVGLGHVGDRYPSQLSGGQQQRIALARAIINRPRLLLLDEPLGALDLKLRRQMQIELKKLQEQLGTTFIFVTHDQEEALVMADRIAVMNRGRVEQMGSGKEIYDRPASRFVADFIGEANLIACTVKAGKLTLRGQPLGGPSVAREDSDYRLLARPERLRPVISASANAIAFPAVVKRTVYMGDAVRIFLELADASEISIKLPSGDPGVPEIAIGQSLTLELLDDNPILYPDRGDHE